MSATLNDMSVADLRDLAKRAEATAVQKEKEAEKAKVLHFGDVGVLVQDGTHAGIKTSTYYFSVEKKTGALGYDLGKGSFAANQARNGVAAVVPGFNRGWFSVTSKDTINTAENRAAVLQLLATVGAWK